MTNSLRLYLMFYNSPAICEGDQMKKENPVYFLASPAFIFLGWIVVVVLGQVFNLGNWWYAVGPIGVLVINFIVSNSHYDSLTDEEKKAEDRFNEPHGPA